MIIVLSELQQSKPGRILVLSIEVLKLFGKAGG